MRIRVFYQRMDPNQKQKKQEIFFFKSWTSGVQKSKRKALILLSETILGFFKNTLQGPILAFSEP